MLPGFIAVDHVSLTVPSIDGALAFYERALGCRRLYRIGPFDARELPSAAARDWTGAYIDVDDARLSLAAVRLPDGDVVEFAEYERPDHRAAAACGNAQAGGRHLALRVGDLEAAVAHLVAHGATAMDGPVVISEGPCAGLHFRYVKDPCGNYLELVAYDHQAWMADEEG